MIDVRRLLLFTMIKESTEILLRLLILVPLSMRILKNTSKILKKFAYILNLGYPGNHVGPISPGILRESRHFMQGYSRFLNPSLSRVLINKVPVHSLTTEVA